MSFRVVHGGALSLLQDAGRRGAHRLGLTNGGPVDREAYYYCNRLLQNDANCCAIEVSMGGLVLKSSVDTWLCLTGAPMPLSINGEEREGWTVQRVRSGDEIRIDYARAGCRAYLGVAQGFEVPPYLGSAATVVREGVGGLNGGALQAGDNIPCPSVHHRRQYFLAPKYQPAYQNRVTVRVVPGYQQRHFSRIEQRRFFGAPYTVSERSDRMGYRLEGSPVRCEIEGVVSESICLGAIQIPPDGQPIVLLNDRQTIGGYPKIGAALSIDAGRMAQLTAGGIVHFAPVTPATARRALLLAQRFTLKKPLAER